MLEQVFLFWTEKKCEGKAVRWADQGEVGIRRKREGEARPAVYMAAAQVKNKIRSIIL